MPKHRCVLRLSSLILYACHPPVQVNNEQHQFQNTVDTNIFIIISQLYSPYSVFVNGFNCAQKLADFVFDVILETVIEKQSDRQLTLVSFLRTSKPYKGYGSSVNNLACHPK